jgi:chromosome segregation ATPase
VCTSSKDQSITYICMRRKGAQHSQRATGTSRAYINSLQVERDEFQTLASLVASLKQESCRHLKLETETQSDIEFIHAQVNSTRKGLGKMTEFIEEAEQNMKFELQAVHVELTQRLADLGHTLERLEFRFTHHIRDYQAMVEEVDRLKDALQTTKTHVHQTDAEVTQKCEQMNQRLAICDGQLHQLTTKMEQWQKEHALHLQSLEARFGQYSSALEMQVQGQ